VSASRSVVVKTVAVVPVNWSRAEIVGALAASRGANPQLSGRTQARVA
jgi:hypothetical protein